MDLDVCRRPIRRSSTFDNVRVERPLSKETSSGYPLGLILEDIDEDMAYAAAFLLRIGNAGKCRQKAVTGIDNVEIGLEMIAKRLPNRLHFAFAEQAVIDEHAGHLRSYCAK